MKFYISEGNLGENATREQVERLIDKLREKGWDVQYGRAENKADDISEFGREKEINDRFADDFMDCLQVMESE